MYHNHPFFYSYSSIVQTLGVIYTGTRKEDAIENPEADEPDDENKLSDDCEILCERVDEVARSKMNETLVNQYFR